MAKDKKKQKKKDKAEKAKAKALKLEKQAEAKAKEVVKAAKKAAKAAADNAKDAAKVVSENAKEAALEAAGGAKEAAGKQAAKLSADAQTALKKAATTKQVAEQVVAQGKHSLGMPPVKLTTPDEEGLTKLSNLFKIFADPTRLRILYALAEGPKCVADIASAAGVTQGATSHQLKSMKQEQLVDFERDGKQVIYSLADDRVQTMLAQGSSFIND